MHTHIMSHNRHSQACTHKYTFQLTTPTPHIYTHMQAYAKICLSDTSLCPTCILRQTPIERKHMHTHIQMHAVMVECITPHSQICHTLHTDTYMPPCTREYISTYLHPPHAHLCIPMHTHIHMYTIYVFPCMCTHAHMHACTHTHQHTHHLGFSLSAGHFSGCRVVWHAHLCPPAAFWALPPT